MLFNTQSVNIKITADEIRGAWKERADRIERKIAEGTLSEEARVHARSLRFMSEHVTSARERGEPENGDGDFYIMDIEDAIRLLIIDPLPLPIFVVELAPPPRSPFRDIVGDIRSSPSVPVGETSGFGPLCDCGAEACDICKGRKKTIFEFSRLCEKCGRPTCRDKTTRCVNCEGKE